VALTAGAFACQSKDGDSLMLTDTAMKQLWRDAERMDDTLHVSPRLLNKLRQKFIRPETYSRHKMFMNMARRQVSIFKGVPVLVRGYKGADTRSTLIHALSMKFPPGETSRVQVGPAHSVTRLPVREIMRRWQGGRAIVGVTDLHIRETKVEEVIATGALSDFNTLIRGSAELALQEMMTLVIASPGNVTDSHSDDPDGTNHCFFGRKLWLAWDAFEGMAAGIEDVERQEVHGQASFDMAKFLRLKSACWFFVATGETLFLPGNLTHKVLTLEPYLGVGSFHIGLPGSLDSLTRWIYHGPLWSISDPKQERAGHVDEVVRLNLRIARRARHGSQRTKDRWGYNYLHKAYNVWRRSVTPEIRQCVLQHAGFRELVDLARTA
jgi:hypothetical protein